jgi:hypothetical protein
MKKVNKNWPVGLNYKTRKVTVGKINIVASLYWNTPVLLQTRMLIASIENRDHWKIFTDVLEEPVFSILKAL